MSDDLEKQIHQDVALLFNNGARPGTAKAPGSAPAEGQSFSLWHDGVKQALGGASDAVNEISDTLNDVWDWGGQNIEALRGLHASLPKVPRLAPEVEQSEHGAGKFIRNATQFLTAFIPYTGALKAVGIGGKILRPLLAGAAADFSAFDPMQERFSNMIKGTPLENSISQYLATDENDTALEGRLKNALEGMALGVPADLLVRGLSKSAKLIKGVGKAKAAVEAQSTFGRSVMNSVDEATVAGLPPGTVPVISDKRMLQSPAKFTDKDINEFIEGAITGTHTEPSKTRSLNLLYTKDTDHLIDTFERMGEAVAKREGEIPKTTLAAIAADAEKMGVTPREAAQLAADVKDLPARMVAVRQVITTGVEALDGVLKAIANGDSTPNTLYAAELLTKNVGTAMKYFTGARKEVATALTSMRIEVGPKGEMATEVAKTLAEGAGAEWTKIAKMWGTLDESGRLHFLNNGTKQGWTDALTHVYINSLLSNPGTTVVNLFSNVANMLMHVGATAGAATVNAVTPWREGAISFRDVKAQMFALFTGASDALGLGWKVFKGEGPSAYGIKYDYTPVSSAAMGLEGVTGKFMDTMLKATGLPTKVMAGTDAMFKSMSMRMVYAQEAFRIAEEGGRPVREIMEELIKNPQNNLALRAEAERMGKLLTFQESTGTVGQAILGLREKVPALKLLVPFVTTPANIVKQVAAMTPGLHKLSGSYAADIAAGGARAEVARAKLATGAAMFGMTAVLAGNGFITGGLDPTTKTAKDLAGVPPYSIKVGDKWYQFNRLDPIGALLGIAADWTELLPRMSGKDSDSIMSSFVTMVSRYTLNRTYLKNVSDVLMALTQPAIHGPKLVQNLAVGMVPYSGTMNWINREVFDQDMREVRSVSDAIISRLPGMSAGLPPSRNPITGDPIKFTERGFFGLSPFPSREQSDDPVLQEVGRLAPRLDWDTKHLSFMGKSIPLSAEYQDELKQVQTMHRNSIGMNLRDSLALQMNSVRYLNMSDLEKKEFIEDHVSKWRSAGTTKFKQSNPEILAQMQMIRLQTRK